MNFLFLLRETGAVIRRRPIATIAFSAMFVIGIMCGILIDKPSAIECYYLNYCDNYIYRIFSESPGGIFLDRLLGSAFFLILVVPSALTIFCVPLQGFLVFYKGFVFGTVTVILVSVYKFSGFLVWLIVLLPQTLLFSLVYILISVIAFDCARESRCRGGGCGGIRDFLIYLLVAAVAAVVCALLEFLIVCLIFRPVSKVL